MLFVCFLLISETMRHTLILIGASGMYPLFPFFGLSPLLEWSSCFTGRKKETLLHVAHFDARIRINMDVSDHIVPPLSPSPSLRASLICRSLISVLSVGFVYGLLLC